MTLTIVPVQHGYSLHHYTNGRFDPLGLPIIAFAVTEMGGGSAAGRFDVKPITPLGEVDLDFYDYAVKYPDGQIEVGGGRRFTDLSHAEEWLKPKAA